MKPWFSFDEPYPLLLLCWFLVFLVHLFIKLSVPCLQLNASPPWIIRLVIWSLSEDGGHSFWLYSSKATECLFPAWVSFLIADILALIFFICKFKPSCSNKTWFSLNNWEVANIACSQNNSKTGLGGMLGKVPPTSSNSVWDTYVGRGEWCLNFISSNFYIQN